VDVEEGLARLTRVEMRDMKRAAIRAAVVGIALVGSAMQVGAAVANTDRGQFTAPIGSCLQPGGTPMTPSYPNGRVPSVPDDPEPGPARSSAVPSPPAAQATTPAEAPSAQATKAAVAEEASAAAAHRVRRPRYRFSHYRYYARPFGNPLSGSGYNGGP
jgi:hypothetical protein